MVVLNNVIYFMQLMSLLDCGHCQPAPSDCLRAIYQLIIMLVCGVVFV